MPDDVQVTISKSTKTTIVFSTQVYPEDAVISVELSSWGDHGDPLRDELYEIAGTVYDRNEAQALFAMLGQALQQNADASDPALD